MTKKRNLIIGCDLDGTLNDLTQFYFEVVPRIILRKPVNLEGYEFEDIYQLNKLERNILGFPVLEKYCSDSELRPDVAETIKDLQNDGCKFHLITARKFVTKDNVIGKYYRYLVNYWLNKNKLKFDSVSFCSEDNVKRDKLMGCLKNKVDVMIDDKPDVALFLAQNGIKVILLDTKYNQGLEHENIIRVKGWDEIRPILNKMKEDQPEIEEKFVAKDIFEINGMTDEQKIEYYKNYRDYLSNVEYLKELSKKGKRRFKLVYDAVYMFIKPSLKPVIIGKEKVPFQDGLIICSNHVDSRDQYMLSLGLGKKYYAGFAAKEIETTLRGRLFKWINGSVFMYRNIPESRKACAEELALRVVNGDNALIFPEGTRKNKEGASEERIAKTTLDFQPGALAMARKTGSPILPCAVYYGNNRNFVKFADLFYVMPTDDITLVTQKLQYIIANMVEELKLEDEKCNFDAIYQNDTDDVKKTR